jgi:hypothetical protein
VREGFECARQTATRKGREEKPTFSLEQFFRFFCPDTFSFLFCFSLKIILFLKVTRASFFYASFENRRCHQRQIFCPPNSKLQHMSPLVF